MVALTPALFTVVVRWGFRLGGDLWNMHDERVRAASAFVTAIPVSSMNLELAALNAVWRRENLRENFPLVFNLDDDTEFLLPNADADQKAAAIQAGLNMLRPPQEAPEWAGRSAAEFLTIHSLLSEEAKRSRWGRFGLLMARAGIQALAAQPSIAGLDANTEKLLGSFASKVDAIIGPNDINPGVVDGHTFKERAAACLLQASVSAIAENPGAVVSGEHWGEFVSAVLTPIADAQASQQGKLITLNRIRGLMRGPMAQAALQVLHDRQGDFLGKRFAADQAAGAVTESILAAAVAVPSERFDIMNTFTQRGLTLVYSSALDAAAKRPELFVHGDGRSVQSWRELLGNVCTILSAAPPPFRNNQGLADQLTCAVIEVTANHLSRAALADVAGEGPWKQTSGKILESIMRGFSSGLQARVRDPEDARTNPFLSVFNQEQVVDIVRLVAAQAAETPQMLLGRDYRNEVYNITQAVAAFMADPGTGLASAQDWRTVIGVAVDEAAKNPGALFQINPDASPEKHLAVQLIGTMLEHASAGFNAETPLRRRGSVLFGDTLRDAIVMTLRGASNNARALLDTPTHMAGLSTFVGDLQNYVQQENGRLGAAEWLFLYRTFVAEVIAKGPAVRIGPDQLEAALQSMHGLSEGEEAADATQPPLAEEPQP